jgi:hypothetical protein
VHVGSRELEHDVEHVAGGWLADNMVYVVRSLLSSIGRALAQGAGRFRHGPQAALGGGPVK